MYLAHTSTDLLLQLIEDTDTIPSITRRRCLCQLVENLSRVAPTESSPYCFDQYQEVPATEMKIIGDDIVPVEVIQTTSEPRRWMKNIVHMCLQQDPIVPTPLLSHL